jgi:hypothetical protein
MKSDKLRQANTSHGDSHSKGTIGHEIYKKWLQMHARCRDVDKPYLRKGIKVCEEWNDYENFKVWVLSKGFDPNLELDRIDNTKGYAPNNCRWVTHAENCRNKDHPLSKPVKNSLGMVFPSAQAASRAFGKGRGAVGKAIKAGHVCAGLTWSYASDEDT